MRVVRASSLEEYARWYLRRDQLKQNILAGSIYRWVPGSENSYRRDDPDTAQAAGNSIAGKLELWQRIREVLEQCGPLTTEGIADILERPVISISPRMVEMEVEGMTHRAGKAKNRSGKAAITWAAGARESSLTSAQTIQPGNPPDNSLTALRAEIERLYQTDTWAALALAQKHNIKCVMEDEQII